MSSQAMMAMAPEQLHHMMPPEQLHHHLSAMANHQVRRKHQNVYHDSKNAFMLTQFLKTMPVNV